MYLHELRLQGFFTQSGYGYKCACCDRIFISTPDHCMIFADNPILPNSFKRDQLVGRNNHAVVNNIFFCEPCVLRSRREAVELDESKLLEINHGQDYWMIHYSGESLSYSE